MPHIAPFVRFLEVPDTPQYWGGAFAKKIFGLGPISPLAFIGANRFQLQGKAINIYIDNNVPTSLVRGDSRNDTIAAAISCFWRIDESFDIDIWMGGVRCEKNSADMPTR